MSERVREAAGSREEARTAEGSLEKAKLLVSTPFRSSGSRALFPDSAFGVDDAGKAAYARALVKEIGAAAKGLDGLAFDEVELGCGPASSMPTELLMDIVRAVRKSLPLVPGARWHAAVAPGGLTADFAGFCKNVEMEYVELEMLTTDEAALRKLGLPPSLEASVECFQVTYFTGAPQIGILVDAAACPPGRPWRRTLIDALGRSPLYVRAVNMGEEAASAASELCAGAGLAPCGEGVWARPGFPGLPAPHASQMGVGLSALTTFDGVSFKNTSDLGLYLAHSDDFSLVARQV